MKRTALVTAGAGCIGLAVVERLLQQDVADHVVVIDLAEVPPEELQGVTYRRYDICALGDLDELLSYLPEQVMTLVNILGGERRPAVAPVTDTAWPPVEVWNDTFDLNVTSVYRLTAAVVDRLVPGSSICNVSSIAACMPWAIAPGYGAAKAALEHWSSSLAMILADRGVRVNLVRPGFVWSKQWAAVDRDEFESIVQDRVPLRQAKFSTPTDREQTADDVAAVVAFLSSDAARQITGQAINVDGGAALARAAR